jgi:hypothetical protein
LWLDRCEASAYLRGVDIRRATAILIAAFGILTVPPAADAQPAGKV